MIQKLTRLQEQFEQTLHSYTANLPKGPLQEPVKYILSLGGKRIRPVLVLLAGEAYGADAVELNAAALAVEVFHNFSLVHDDIMDAAPLRRGKATVHKKWNDSTAILSGDAMLIEAYRQLSQTGVKTLPALLDLFNTTSMEVCEGQQRDMDFETRSAVSADEYLEMIRLKTAVLLGCSLKMGAILGSASAKDAGALYNFGIHAGIGFQIQDDYLDAFADPEKFGKQTGGDIRANKKSFLIIKALEMADSSTRTKLTSLYFNPAKSSEEMKVQQVLRIFRMLGIDEAARRASETHFQKARMELDHTALDATNKEGFLAFLNLLQQRKT